MAKGDLVGPSPGGEHNHILTGNPKSVVCGKFRPSGWPEPKDGADLCKRCDSKYQVNPDSRPLPDTAGRKLGSPLPKAPQDDHYAYLADKHKGTMGNDKTWWNGNRHG